MIMNAIRATANSCKPMCPLFRNSLLASVRVVSLLRKFTLVFSSAVNQWRPSEARARLRSMTSARNSSGFGTVARSHIGTTIRAERLGPR